MKIRCLAVLVSAFCSSVSWAAEPFVVRDIRVEGIQRTEAGTVFSYLPVKVGDMLDDEKAAAAIKALYATGFFKDVRLESDNGVLLVVVEERPAIAQINIVGAKEFEKSKLKDGLKQAGLTESRIFDRSLLERAEQELKQQYISRGKYAVKITTTTTPLERNRVAINFDINEGETAKIRKINIVGSKAFQERDLLGQLVLRTPGLLTWFTKDDQYSKQKLGADLETLRSYYLNRGYLEFSIDSTQVSITPDMQDIYITINITEGPNYTVSEIKLAGEMLLPEAEVRKLIKLAPGEVFARERLTESVKLITDRLGNDGYAFANVNASPELDKEKRQVGFTFFIDPGRRVYVRRINITGNDRTRDEVIRREIRQLEGGWYSTAKIAQSKIRIDRLNFFTAVNLETPPVAGTTDKIDINIDVKERPTGAVTFGAGYAQQQGIILSGSVAQDNIFGSGNNVNVQVSTGTINKVYSASFTNPYFTKDGVSAGFDIYHRVLNTNSLAGVAALNTGTTGAGVRFGIPVNENDTISVGLGLESTDIRNANTQRYQDFIDTFGKVTTNIPVTLSWARDGRDSAIWTTSGTTHRAFTEVGVPGADLQYYKASYALKWFYPISKDFTLMLHGEAGIGDGYSGKPLPFFKNFFAGGNTSVRGYMISSLGPRDDRGRALGGNQRVVGSAEIMFPLPGMKNDRSVRLSTFLDAGTVFGPGGSPKFAAQEGMRYSAGLAVMWISPMGPLKVSIAEPLNDQPGDTLQRFQFQFGQTF